MIDNRKGVDRLQGFWKVNGKDASGGNVNKINPGCHTAHVIFAKTGNYRGTATSSSILGAKAKLKCSFSDLILFLKLR